MGVRAGVSLVICKLTLNRVFMTSRIPAVRCPPASSRRRCRQGFASAAEGNQSRDQ